MSPLRKPGKQIINPYELFSMIVLFEFGTALVVPIGLHAQQGTWLSILLALPGGLLLFLLYEYLSRQHPDFILSGYAKKIAGRFVGSGIGFLYIAFFIYIASRVLRDGGDLLVASTYDQTPMLVINASMMIAVMYVLNKGLEVFFRLAQIYIFIMLSLGMLGNLSILFSGMVEVNNLLPLFGSGGWGSVVNAAYPYILMFPYGELIVFSAVLPHLNRREAARKTGMTAIVFSGVALSVTHVLQISVLGADIYSRSTFPLIEAIGLVNIAEFIQRLDALVILTLIIGVFFKVAMFSYAAMAVTADLFKVPDAGKLSVPIGVVVLFSSKFSAWSFPEHLKEGVVTIETHLIFFCIVIPVLLLLVHIVRKRFNLYR